MGLPFLLSQPSAEDFEGTQGEAAGEGGEVLLHIRKSTVQMELQNWLQSIRFLEKKEK